MNKEMHDTLWEQYKNAAFSAVHQGNLSRAGRVLREAFREAEEYGEIDPSLVELAYDLADLHIDRAQYSEAERLLRLVLEVREKLLGQTHEDVVDSLKKLAIVQILAFRAEALGHSAPERNYCWTDGIAAAAS